jgi:hypothetical protein
MRLRQRTIDFVAVTTLPFLRIEQGTEYPYILHKVPNDVPLKGLSKPPELRFRWLFFWLSRGRQGLSGHKINPIPWGDDMVRLGGSGVGGKIGACSEPLLPEVAMLYNLLKLTHVLSILVWVGGMVFAHFFLRPCRGCAAAARAAAADARRVGPVFQGGAVVVHLWPWCQGFG